MKKRFLLIPAIGLPLLAAIPAISSYSNVISKATQNKANAIVQTDASDYSVITPSWTHYAVGEKLDLRDLKVTYNDPEKGTIDVTNECELSMQNDKELTEAGEFDVTIQHNDFNSSFKIYVEKEPTEAPDPKLIMCWFGDICTKFRLMSNQECILTEYIGGEGIFEIPDYVLDKGTKYFIKQIPSDWSDGTNNITGLKFNENVSHLKKICDNAFAGTNCLDWYIDNKKELLEFPEGLEEIGSEAFYGTDYTAYSIKGYSFPSTLKKIGPKAFSKAPYIDGDGETGTLVFKSIPEIDSDAFYICGAPKHDCKWVFGSSLDIAKIMHSKLKKSDDFNSTKDFLIPRLINENYCKVIENKWGDITVECELISDECIMLGYVEGEGTLVIPDHVLYNDKSYYVKEIPSDWSNGADSIKGLKFEEDVSHLKKICDNAFAGTNCLDIYMDNKSEPLIFPEGLEEIGSGIFANTSCTGNCIKGYSFPSTLKVVKARAFAEFSPYIDGDNNNGQLQFRSIPEIGKDAFKIYNWYGVICPHHCKYICAPSLEMGDKIIHLIRNNFADQFILDQGYLINTLIA